MPTPSYRQAGLALKRGAREATEQQIRALQRDLRRLGYLRSRIEGDFGAGTERAVKALQYDLLSNDGSSRGGDGPAPVRVLDYNRGRVVDVTGEVDEALAACMADMLDDAAFPLLPFAEDPVEENRRIVAAIREIRPEDVPIPFLLAILKQESNLKHFHEPRRGDEDTYIVVGLDTNATERHIITSRGYGVGQYTLFHHPPRPEEIDEFMNDVGGNLQKAIGELREKFAHFVNGPTSGTRADDRLVEVGDGPLRRCTYDPPDPRYLQDCVQCAKGAGTEDTAVGVTPLYDGSHHTYRPTRYYRRASYQNVPIRANVGCDWPYAVRRYNGSGINSYHYQARVLKHLGSG